jgi:hypothetical protein
MAQRRMFSLKIIDTDLFLDMPMTTRLLYYDLNMRADDDGFVASPKKIQRMVGCSDDDLKLLIAKKFIIPFESGVCVIRHWRVHNYIQPDRYSSTMYQYERNMLENENGIYNIVQCEAETKCIQNVVQNVDNMSYNLDTQVRLELGKSKDIDKEINTDNYPDEFQVFNFWNESKAGMNHKELAPFLKMITTAIKKYKLENVITGIKRLSIAYNDKSYFYKQNWNLGKFLKQGNGISSWINDAEYWNAYVKAKDSKGGEYGGFNSQNNGGSKGKWAGYKPPEPTITNTDETGII